MNKLPLLKVEDLQIEFHDHSLPETAVYDFDLTLMKGEIVGIVGESGAGKSLSALAIAGLLKRHSAIRAGRILFDDLDLSNCSREVLREYQGDEIAVIFQEPMSSLNPVKRVGEQVEESLRIHHREIDRKERKERAIRALESVGLKESARVYESYPHELSGGMRQRAMIAAAMIAEPQILIADEPTTALDVTVQAQILALLKQINREKGTTVLFISHDLRVIRQLCSRVLVMKDGRVVEEGDTERIFEHPREEYTRSLIRAIPQVKQKEPAPPREREILAVSHLDAGYGKRSVKKNAATGKILTDVSFVLKEGEILGLAGESGSGKSTLARTILGLLKPMAGTITRKDFRPAMVFQDPYGSLNPAYPVRWILEEAYTGGGRIRGGSPTEIREKIIDALARVELPESFLERKPAELSGGQRQRVAIAEALIADPNVLIADEPVSALDVTVQSQILKLLADLRDKTGVSILFISHDLSVIHSLCERVLIMKKGQIVEAGEVDAVYRDPEHPYTKELLAAAGLYHM